MSGNANARARTHTPNRHARTRAHVCAPSRDPSVRVRILRACASQRGVHRNRESAGRAETRGRARHVRDLRSARSMADWGRASASSKARLAAHRVERLRRRVAVSLAQREGLAAQRAEAVGEVSARPLITQRKQGNKGSKTERFPTAQLNAGKCRAGDGWFHVNYVQTKHASSLRLAKRNQDKPTWSTAAAVRILRAGQQRRAHT
eukprot:3503145-Pleurochrysis_carterae.AAC.1